MNIKKLLTTLKPLILSFILVGGLSYIYAWTGPTQAPTGGNVAAPLNTSSNPQAKNGSVLASTLNIGGTLSSDSLAVFGDGVFNGKVTAPQYCIGGSCITSWSGGGDGIPSGAIMAFYLSSCPSGWKPTNGADGTPDLRGYFVRALGTNSDGTASAALGVKVGDDLKSHNHTGTTDVAGWHSHSGNLHGFKETGAGNTSGNDTYGFTGQDYLAPALTINGDGNHTHTFTTNATGGSETRPKNIALLYCQKI